MALSPVNFQPLSFQQAAPFVSGMQAGNNIIGQGLQNQLAQLQLPYAGQMAQAQLAAQQQQAPYLQSQTALNQATLPLLGYKFRAPFISAMSGQTRNAILNNNSIIASSRTPEGQQRMAIDPVYRQQVMMAQNNAAALASSQYGMTQFPGINSPIPGTQSQFAPQSQQQNGTMNPQGVPSSAPNLNQQQLPLSQSQTQRLQQLFPQNGQPPTFNQALGANSSQQNAQNSNALQQVSALQAQKGTTDPVARQKNLFAANIEKTLGMVNPQDLTQYAGISGQGELTGQKLLAGLNKESPAYDNYLKSSQAADLLAHQVRQFYGDSIQPSMMENLQKLTDPSEWSNNPKLATQLFNQTKTILQNEMGTYRQAMQSTAPYRTQTPQNNASAQPNAQQQGSISKALNGRNYVKMNGQWYAQ